MGLPNIALIGKAGSGKDTVAERLTTRWAYTRLAFADPLRHVALDINPYIPTGPGITVRLHALVADVGWDYAKRTYPEVRRVLQQAGQGVRNIDPDFWLNLLMKKVEAARSWNMPLVVTDCRYENEAIALRLAGFRTVRVHRPRGTAMTFSEGRAAMHASETELDDYPCDGTLHNVSTVSDLIAAADALIQ
ncbi:hypothetical protein ACWCXC_15605 [Streptomyces sp. NPDC001515]